MNTAEIVYRGRAELAEGPNWHDGALWWVNIVSGTLNRLDPASGVNISRATGGFLGAAAPCVDGRWLLARQRDCALLDWTTGKIEVLHEAFDAVAADQRFNDGKCDPQGRFWVGTLTLKETPGRAGLYCQEANGKFRPVLQGLTLANGLGWSPDGSRFFHIDTPTRKVSVYDFDAARGTLAGGRALIQFSDTDGYPDGMTVDAAGNLWVALWGGSAVAEVDGRSGKILAKHPVPAAQVSCCTFGGPDLRTLYITTAWENLTLDQRIAAPSAGSIFALRTEVAGLPALKFSTP
jgi:sugar lactone lactonase YvrE